MSNKQPSRRTLLKTAAAVGAAVASTRPARAAAPSASVLDLRVISPDHAYYHGWPTLARQKSGRLLLAWSGGREHHVCPFGRVDYMTSDDDGAHWTWPRTLLDSAIDDRDAGVMETAKGTLLVTTFTSLAYVSYWTKAEAAFNAADSSLVKGWSLERMNSWRATHQRTTDAEKKADLGVFALRSTDNGLTWSPRINTILNSPHGPIQLSDGRLLYPGVGLWEPERRVGVAESTDDGVTWRYLADIPARQGDVTKEYHELHGVEVAPGHVVVHIRTHNKSNNNETLQTESTDGGKTWSEPKSIGVWGLPSHLLKLKSGHLLMTYGYRRPPFGNQARLSTDHGKTWSEPVTLSADGAGVDLGYPSTVELNDGSLLTVWYEQLKGNPKAVLRQAKWKLA